MIKIKFVKLWDLISYLERASWKLSTRPNVSSLWQMDIIFFISPIFSIILHWTLQFRSSAKLKTSQHNHSMSNFGLFFLSSKFACALRFNRKSQPCIFLRWFALRFPVKTYVKKLGAFCSLLLNDKQKKPFVFPNNETSEASRSRLFFAHVFTRKWSANQRGKIRAVTFY